MATRKCSSCGGPLAPGTNVCPYCGSENIEVTATSWGKVSPGKDKSFDVILKRLGPNKIHVIKTIREFRALGLKESKELADNAPSLIKAKLTGDEADKLKNALEEAGAGAAIVEHGTDTTAYMLPEGRATGGTGTESSSGCFYTFLGIFFIGLVVFFVIGLLSNFNEKRKLNAYYEEENKKVEDERTLHCINSGLVDWIYDTDPAVPPASLEELRTLLVPKYLEALPLKDSLGNPLYYAVKGDTYYLAFAGHDGKFDGFYWGDWEKNDKKGDDYIFRNSLPTEEYRLKVLKHRNQRWPVYDQADVQYMVTGSCSSLDVSLIDDSGKQRVKNVDPPTSFFIGKALISQKLYISVRAGTYDCILEVKIYKRGVLYKSGRRYCRNASITLSGTF